jgi:hypothetical protein
MPIQNPNANNYYHELHIFRIFYKPPVFAPVITTSQVGLISSISLNYQTRSINRDAS